MLRNTTAMQKRVNEIENQRREVKKAKNEYENNKTSENYDKLLVERKKMQKIHKVSTRNKNSVNYTQEEIKEVMERFESEINIPYEEREYGLMSLGEYYHM